MESEQFRPSRRRGRPVRGDIYTVLRREIDELWAHMGGLPSPVEAAGIWRGIWFEEAHHSTAIEGNTLVLKQVEVLLAEGRAVGDKELREYLEVRGYADAADWVYRQAISPGSWSSGTVLASTEVRQIHRMVMSAAWDVAPHPQASDRESPGAYREHDIHAFPGGMTPVSWPLVPAEMAEWLGQANSLSQRDPTVPERLAALHSRFEQIHPFLDGNGRTGRLLLNLHLIRLGYPPAIIYKRQRSDYLRAVRRADDGDPGQLGELLARAVLDNLYRFVVPAVTGSDRLVPLGALATKQITADALRTAAIRGRLQATQGADGRWRSSRTWVKVYLARRYERDRHP